MSEEEIWYAWVVTHRADPQGLLRPAALNPRDFLAGPAGVSDEHRAMAHHAGRLFQLVDAHGFVVARGDFYASDCPDSDWTASLYAFAPLMDFRRMAHGELASHPLLEHYGAVAIMFYRDGVWTTL